MSERPGNQGPELGGPSPGGTPPPEPHDLLDPEQPFDAAQWALHGLLCAHFERLGADPDARAKAILERVRTSDQSPSGSEGHTSPERQRRVPAWHPFGLLLRHPRWLLSAGMAAAIAFVVLLIVRSPQAQAHGRAEACFLAGGGITDPEDIGTTEARIRTNRQRRDEIVALGTDAARKQIARLWPPWNRIIRDLRDLGRFDEALKEAEAARQCSRECESWDWEFVLLADIGAIHARQGRFDQAREAFRASIDARNRVSGDLNEASDRGRAARDSEYHTLGPLYRYMACVEISVADLDDARQWQGRGEQALRYTLRRHCEQTPASSPANASLTELWHVAFDHARAEIDRVTADDGPWQGLPNDAVSLAAKLREHLLVEARLRRLEENLDGAEQALKDAESLPHSPRVDESRMEFNGPMERARIAIARAGAAAARGKDAAAHADDPVARGHYMAALAAVEKASAHTGWLRIARGFEDPVAVDSPPIGPLARAELDLLHGVALLGLHRDDKDVSDGRRLVEQAVRVPQEMAKGMNDEQRAAFLRQFIPWDTLVKTVKR